MNMAIDMKQFEPLLISFSETKKNNIINGNFSKIIYSDSNITFNGLYIYFQIIPHHVVRYNDKKCQNDEQKILSKNDYSIFYLDSNSFNINIVNSLSTIENDIIEYYKELNKVDKISVYQLKTQLESGNIKIYKNENNKKDEKPNIINNNNNNVVKRHYSTIHHYYTNAYTNMSLKEAEERGIRKEMKNYLLKISGIWENKFSVGITYKISELGNKV